MLRVVCGFVCVVVLFVVRYTLFAVCCALCVICNFAVCCSLFLLCRFLEGVFVVRCLLIVGDCSL